MAAASGYHALRGEGDELVEQLAVGVALLARGQGLADQLEEAAAYARTDAHGHHEVLVLHDQLKEAPHRQCSRGEDNEDERPDGEGRTGRELLSPVAEPLRLGRDQRADSLLEEPARPEPALVCDEARRGEEEVGPELQRDAQLGGREIAGGDRGTRRGRAAVSGPAACWSWVGGTGGGRGSLSGSSRARWRPRAG